MLADSAKEGVRYAIVHGSANTGGCGPALCAAITGAPGTGIVKTYAQYSLHNTTTMTVTVDYTVVNNIVPVYTSPAWFG